jgi:Phospholipase/Carboxylesterase
MAKKTPVITDFPAPLTVAIDYPTTGQAPSPNILILLHGLGDTTTSFSSLGRGLNLPETTCITVQAPTSLPLDLVGFHWGDDVMFDPATTGLDQDAGFSRAVKLLAEEVVKNVLVSHCGYQLREILMLGFGQGGMAALAATRDIGRPAWLSSIAADMNNNNNNPQGNLNTALAGVVSIGAPYPLSASTIGPKNHTPVLLVAGSGFTTVTDVAVHRTQENFEIVELHRWARHGDGMPRNREEMLPVMQFFARRLRSRQGVPEGSIELT